MTEPLRQIVANAGEEASVILDRVRRGKGNCGYDAAKGEMGPIATYRPTRAGLSAAIS
jgi:chaperonin GroEL